MDLLFSCERIYYNLGSSKKIDDLIFQGLEKFQRTKSRSGTPNPMIIDPSILIDRLRLIKTKEEINLMQKAIDITAEGFRKAIENTSEGLYEYEIQEIMEKEFPGYHHVEIGSSSTFKINSFEYSVSPS